VISGLYVLGTLASMVSRRRAGLPIRNKIVVPK